MLTLTLPPAVEDRLAEQARAAGVDLPTYASHRLTEVANNGAPTSSDPAAIVTTPVEGAHEKASRQGKALRAFTAAMTEWTSKNLPPGHFVDDDRGLIYGIGERT